MKSFKSYGFWTALAGAVVILVNALGDLFGFKIESTLIENVIMGIAGVLVAVGVVSMGGNKDGSALADAEEGAKEEENVQDANNSENDVTDEKLQENSAKTEENVVKTDEKTIKNDEKAEIDEK